MSMMQDDEFDFAPPPPRRAPAAHPAPEPVRAGGQGVSGYTTAINRLRRAGQDIFDREGTARAIAAAYLDQVNTVLNSCVGASTHDGQIAISALEGVRVDDTPAMNKAKAVVMVAVAEWIGGNEFDDAYLDVPLRSADTIML